MIDERQITRYNESHVIRSEYRFDVPGSHSQSLLFFSFDGIGDSTYLETTAVVAIAYSFNGRRDQTIHSCYILLHYGCRHWFWFQFLIMLSFHNVTASCIRQCKPLSDVFSNFYEEITSNYDHRLYESIYNLCYDHNYINR